MNNFFIKNYSYLLLFFALFEICSSQTLTVSLTQEIPVNKTNESIENFFLQDYDEAETYKVSLSVSSSLSSSFSIIVTDELARDTGFNSWTNITSLNFTGSPTRIQNGLNSMVFNTTSDINGIIILNVVITKQVDNTFYNPTNGHIYKFIPGQITFLNARTAASSSLYEGVPGYLVTITSADEQSFINSKTDAKNIWTGLSDENSEGDWMWLDGPEAGTVIMTGNSTPVEGQYNNWATSEPNDWNTGEDYMVTSWQSGSQWNDFGPPATTGTGDIGGYLVEFGSWSNAEDSTFSLTENKQIKITQVRLNTTLDFMDITKTYGDPNFDLTATSSSTGAFTFSISDTDIASVTGSTVSIVSSGITIATVSQAADNNYNAATATMTLTVNKADPLIGFNDIISTYGDPNFDLTAISSSTGVFTFSISDTDIASVTGSTVSIVSSGITIATVSQAADNNYNAATATMTLTVNKADPLIGFNDIISTYGDPNFDLTATSSSTGVFTFSISDTDIASVTGSTVSIVSSGITIATVSQAADNNYNAATATMTLTVNKEIPLITFNDITKTYGDPNFDLTATSSSTGAFTFSISDTDIASVTGSTVSIVSSGITIATVSQAADNNYNAATATMTLTVNKEIPLITFNDITKTYGDPNFDLTATSSSTGAFTFSILDTDIASVTGSTVSIVSSGITIATVSQAADNNYNAATATMTLTVNKEIPLITFNDITKTYGDPNFDLTATSSSTGVFTFSISDTDIASVTGSTVSIVSSGITIATVSQAADNNYNAATATMTLTVNKEIPLITFNDITKTYGDPNFDLTATSSSTGAFTFSISDTDIASVTGSTVSIVSSGITIATVSQAADNNYNAATATMTLTVNKEIPLITFNDITKTYGDPNFDLTATSSSTGAFTFSILDTDIASVTGSTVSIVSSGITIATVSQAADNNYNAATATMTLTVNKADPLIGFNDIISTYGDQPLLISNSHITLYDEQEFYNLNVSSSDNFYATISTTLDGIYRQNKIILHNAGQSSITIYHPETLNYNAVSVTLNLQINKLTPTFKEPYGTLYAEVNENGIVNLSTPNGELFSEVIFASYGNPTGTAGDYKIGNCHATNSLTKTENEVIGKSSFSISGSNAFFGDPCFGTIKKYYVKVKYGQDSYDLNNLTKLTIDDDFDKIALTDSNGSISFSSSNKDVIEIISSTLTTSGTVGRHRIIGEGQTVISIFQVATDNYNSTSTSYTVSINKVDSVILLNDISKTYGDPNFDLTATSSSTGAFTFSISDTDIASVTGSTVSIVSSGITIATVSQAADNNYNAATATMTLTVNKADPLITFNDITKTYGDPNFDLTASSSSTGVFTFSISDTDIASVTGSTVSIVSSGITIATVSQAADNNYNAATATMTLTVNNEIPLITFNDITKTYGDPNFDLTASSSSTGVFTFSISDTDIASVTGSTVSIVSSGITIATVSQAADNNYNAATATMTLTVNKEIPLITFNDITKTYGDPNFDLTASSSSTGVFTFSISDTDIASVMGSTVSIVSSGITIATVSQAADNNYNAATATMTLTVNKADPLITFNDITKTYGDPNFDLTASSSSTGAFTFSISDTDIASVTGSTVSIVSSGITIATVSQAADNNYNSATATMTLTVNKADPIIIFENFSVDLVDSQFIIPFESNSNGDLTFNLLNEELGIINLNSLLPQEIGQTTMYLFQSETSNFNSGNAIATLSILEGIDSDQDGITDTYDLDDDNDGILDVKEKSDDFDGDGVINSLDIDSDGDGCFDVIEAGFSDPDFDGIVGTSPVVVNNFGIVQNSNAYSDPLDLNQNLNYDFLEFAKDFKLYNLNLPDQIEFNLNETLLIDIGVENSNQLNYQWQISSDDGKSFSNLNQTNHILEIKPNLEDDKNQYRIVIDQIGFECSDIFISNSTKINYSQVFIPSGFSPNGDGVNDFWQIIGLDKYPNNKVSVFNRLGIKIYESTNYNNDWNGFYNGNLISDGTYYYIINYGTGNIKKGFIYVNTN